MNQKVFDLVTLNLVLAMSFYHIQGEIQKESRIVGGQPASPGQFPWIISLQRQRLGSFRHFCAGSIVNPLHVVTAAHCVWNKANVSLSIVAGAFNIAESESGQQRINVVEIIVHPEYKSRNRPGPNDIAILKLETEIIFDTSTKAVPMRDPNTPIRGTCKYAGWGNRFLVTGIYYKPSDVLRTEDAVILSRGVCSLKYFILIFGDMLDTALCTSAGPLRGFCQGDSGGPVTCYDDDGNPFLAGIVSWGWFICGDGIHPDVATDVSLFIDFITTNSQIQQP